MHHPPAPSLPPRSSRSGGGIGLLGWFLIILGVCGALFNFALYYKITHVQQPTSTSTSADNNNNNELEAAVLHQKNNNDPAVSVDAKKIENNVNNNNKKDEKDEDDGGDAAAKRKREHRKHLREQGEKEGHHHHKRDHEEHDDKKKQQDQHDHGHQHPHEKDKQQPKQEEKPFNKHEQEDSNQKLAKEHNKQHHHQHDTEKQWDDALKANDVANLKDDENNKKHHAHKENKNNNKDVKKEDPEGEKNELEEEKKMQRRRLHEKHRKQREMLQKQKEGNKDAASTSGSSSTTPEGKKHHEHHNKKQAEEAVDSNKEKQKEDEGAGHGHHHHHNNKHEKAGEEKKQKEQQDGGKKGEENNENKHRHHNQHGAEDKKENENKIDDEASGEGEKKNPKHHKHHGHQKQHHNKTKDGDVAANETNKKDKKDGERDAHALSEKGGGGANKQQQQNQEEQPLAPTKKPLSRKEKVKFGRKAFHQFDQSAFAPVEYSAAFANFVNWTSKDNRLTNVEQSSNHFEDIIEQPNMGVLLPDDGDGFFDDIPQFWTGEDEEDEKIIADKNLIPCDPDDAEFTPEKDRLCVHYLRNPRNWVSIKVMSSILSTGRTIKFKVFLKNPKFNNTKSENDEGDQGADDNATATTANNNNNDVKKQQQKERYIAAIVKVSQKKFLLEPASEIEAFYTDRFIGFNKVPPVSWTPVPLKFFESACGSFSQFYSNWFKQFVEENKGAKSLISKRGPALEHKYLNVSLQLWMNNVHDADMTDIRPSMSYAKYLACPPSKKQQQQGNDNNNNNTTINNENNNNNNNNKFTDAAQWTETKNISLSGLVDVSLFDFIIGNSDRWFGHNMFALEYPKNSDSSTKDEQKTRKKKSSFIFLDQGSSFYSRAIPDELIYFRKMTPEEKEKEKNGKLTDAEKDDAHVRRDLCRFRKPIAERILQLGLKASDEDDANDYYHYMRSNLPSGIFHVGSPALLKACRSRLGALARMIQDCKKSCDDEKQVFLWE